MAHFLFIDESGQDERDSPYAVLAGITVEDNKAWKMIDSIVRAENRFFGCRYGRIKEEFKGRKFLKKKVFRQAGQEPPIDFEERRILSHDCLVSGHAGSRLQITALAQAKLEFVHEVLDIARSFECHAFASVVLRGAPRLQNNALRKDYSYLFERFYYFLEDLGLDAQGIVVFDELEKTQSKILIDQMQEYFLKTARGIQRARQIIPQPFFVHSDLTTLIQVADLVAYIIAWGFRVPGTLDAPARAELNDYVSKIASMRYRAMRNIMGNPHFGVWSIAAIDDLRSAIEQAQ